MAAVYQLELGEDGVFAEHVGFHWNEKDLPKQDVNGVEIVRYVLCDEFNFLNDLYDDLLQVVDEHEETIDRLNLQVKLLKAQIKGNAD